MTMKAMRYLEGFCETAICKSVSEAARRMGISQPSLSRQLVQLEEIVGSELVRRDGNGIRLTRNGEQLFQALNTPMQQIENAIRTSKADSNLLTGTIRLATLTEIGQAAVFPLILKFRKKYPTISFDVQYLKEYEILESMRSGTLEFGVITNPNPSENLICKPWQKERTVLVTRFSNQSNLRKSADLNDASFIAYRNGDPLLNAWTRHAFPEEKSSMVTPQILVNSHRSMLEGLLEFDSYAVMPWQSVSEHIANRLLRVASPHELSGTLHLVWPKGRRRRMDQLVADFFLEAAAVD